MLFAHVRCEILQVRVAAGSFLKVQMINHHICQGPGQRTHWQTKFERWRKVLLRFGSSPYWWSARMSADLRLRVHSYRVVCSYAPKSAAVLPGRAHTSKGGQSPITQVAKLCSRDRCWCRPPLIASSSRYGVAGCITNPLLPCLHAALDNLQLAGVKQKVSDLKRRRETRQQAPKGHQNRMHGFRGKPA